MPKRWFKVNRVPADAKGECETCHTQVTPDQQRAGQARQADDGSVRHQGCAPKPEPKQSR